MASRTTVNNKYSENYYSPTDEELNNMDWKKFAPRNMISPDNQSSMSKTEWKMRCFIHKIRIKINKLLSCFISSDED